MVKSIALVVIALIIGLSGVCMASNYKLIQDRYEVQEGDTLDSIAITYIDKNTYGARGFKEFRAGIIELNPWLLERDVCKGDVVRINYWVTAKDN